VSDYFTFYNALKTKALPRVVAAGSIVSSGFMQHVKRISAQRRFWVSLAELAAIVLVTYAVSYWSVPCALILGGLSAIVAIEVRPAPRPKLPRLLPPIENMRRQAESAAMLINQERLGIGFIEPNAADNLSADDCERLIIAARSLGVKT
jgi:hypothetical protein